MSDFEGEGKVPADYIPLHSSQRDSRAGSIPSLIHSTFNSLTFKKQIWRPPTLHRDITSPFISPAHPEMPGKIEVESKYEKHREENFYELFYDLIFVAAAIQIGHVIQSDITFKGLTKTGLLFFVTRATWSQLMAYQNRLDNSDIIHYLLYLLQAICAFVMAEHITIDEIQTGWDREKNLFAFSIAATISRFSLALMHMQVVSLSAKYRSFFVAICISQVFGAFFYFIPAVLQASHAHYYILWILAICSEGFGIMLYFRCCVPKEKYVPWHMGHLMRREVNIPPHKTNIICF
jgi:low temperature requirement protein LtrA